MEKTDRAAQFLSVKGLLAEPPGRAGPVKITLVVDRPFPIDQRPGVARQTRVFLVELLVHRALTNSDDGRPRGLVKMLKHVTEALPGAANLLLRPRALLISGGREQRGGETCLPSIK